MGYGYVQYADTKSAESALMGLKGVKLKGKKIYVRHHCTKEVSKTFVAVRSGSLTILLDQERREHLVKKARAKSAKIHFKNLNYQVTKAQLEETFGKFESFTSVVLPLLPPAREKNMGFGYAYFGEHEDAVAAIQALNKTMYSGRLLFVQWAMKKKELKRLSRNSSPQHNHQANKPHNQKTRTEIECSRTANIIGKLVRYSGDPSAGFGSVRSCGPGKITLTIANSNNRITDFWARTCMERVSTNHQQPRLFFEQYFLLLLLFRSSAGENRMLTAPTMTWPTSHF